MERGFTPSTPADRAPRLPRTRSQATVRKAGSQTRLYRSQNRRLGLVGSPLVQLGLDSQYPRPRPHRGRATDASVFTGDLLTLPVPLLRLAGSLRHVRGFPALGLLRTLRPIPGPSADGGPARRRPGWAAGRAAPDGSHVHHEPVDGVGAQLCPCSLATSTPQAFLVASWPAPITDSESPLADQHAACTAARPISTRLEPVSCLRGFNHWFTLRTPSRLACRTRAVWQCRPVPSLSGLLPTLPCASRVRLPSASPACCDRPKVESFHPHPVHGASWRTPAS